MSQIVPLDGTSAIERSEPPGLDTGDADPCGVTKRLEVGFPLVLKTLVHARLSKVC